MLESIKLIATRAISQLKEQDKQLDRILLNPNQLEQARIQIDNLINAYRQVLNLIQKAEEQHATVGLGLLSRQLNQSSAPELNAVDLMSNFLKILELPSKTTFSMNKEPHQSSRIDTAKMLAFFPLMFMVPLVSCLSPALFLSPLPWLYLIISALPLLLTYACDKPMSMPRWYQEMAGIEKALACTNLGLAAFCALPFLFMPEIPLIFAVMALVGLLVVGLSLLKHSQHLKAKHKVLSTEAESVKQQLKPNKEMLHRFFEPEESKEKLHHNSDAFDALQSITASA